MTNISSNSNIIDTILIRTHFFMIFDKKHMMISIAILQLHKKCFSYFSALWWQSLCAVSFLSYFKFVSVYARVNRSRIIGANNILELSYHRRHHWLTQVTIAISYISYALWYLSVFIRLFLFICPVMGKTMIMLCVAALYWKWYNLEDRTFLYFGVRLILFYRCLVCNVW